MNFGKIISALAEHNGAIGRGARRVGHELEMRNYKNLVKSGNTDELERLYPELKNISKNIDFGDVQTNSTLNKKIKELDEIKAYMQRTGKFDKIRQADERLKSLWSNGKHGTPEAHQAHSDYIENTDRDPMYRRMKKLEGEIDFYKQSVADGEIPF